MKFSCKVWLKFGVLNHKCSFTMYNFYCNPPSPSLFCIIVAFFWAKEEQEQLLYSVPCREDVKISTLCSSYFLKSNHISFFFSPNQWTLLLKVFHCIFFPHRAAWKIWISYLDNAQNAAKFKCFQHENFVFKNVHFKSFREP